MAYDEALAERVRSELEGEAGLTEKAMFGGLGFMVGGHMAVAVSGQGGLMVRCAPEDTERLLAEPLAFPMEMRGKDMSGWLRVSDDGLDDAALGRWVEVGRDYCRSLPPKG